MKRLTLATASLMALFSLHAGADEPRGAPPDPSRGDSYDGRTPNPAGRDAALIAPRVLLFPMRFLFIALEPPAHYMTELEQRYHIYQRINDLLTSRDGLIGVRPQLHYSVAFKPSFGASFFDDRAFGYETSLNAIAEGGPDVVHGEILARPTPYSSPVQLTVGSLYDRRNDRLFAGVDNTVPVPYGQLGPTRYQSDNVDVDANVAFRLLPPLVFSVGGAFGWRQFANGEHFDDPPIGDVYCQRTSDGTCIPGTIDSGLVPGFNQGTRFLRGNAALVLDLRDSAVHSTVGLLLSVGGDYSHGLGNDQSSYFRLYGSAALPINLWAHRHVLLLRAGTQLAAPVGGSIIPFSELPTLGGPNDLRGFRDQLLRGHSSLVATLEYRFPVWMWMDAALFADYGGVFQQWYSGFGAARMQPDVGAALRLFSRDRFWLRVQLAYGWGEGWRFTLSTSNWP